MSGRPAVRRLFLLRHAKSSWKDASLPDAERPLNKRGRRACELLCSHIAAERIAPELVLCSTSRRTLETLERVEAGFDPAPEVSTDERIYHARAADLLAIARETNPACNSLMVVGHNPAIGELAARLPSEGDGLAAVREKFAAGALATIVLASPWAELGEGLGRLESYVRPNSLEAPQ